MPRVSRHGGQRLNSRLNVDPLAVNRFMEATEPRRVSYEEACGIVPMLNPPDAKTEFYAIPDPVKPDEEAVMVVRENTQVTVVTRITGMISGIEGDSINGVRVIRTLGGEVYEDKGWLRSLRQKRMCQTAFIRPRKRR